ncbi:hypothetical protein [Flavobacterium hungaricum]|uniref:Uncharacterized protein n=1 Tax=Flavobacterium hungaricum TaxID=2082725 RepID=A0ABR9TE29_9FLAO|nr:hypothetical protein [Flavobacterium hungaricum]MBE8723611.1 hypothetical protein [Flavobacterium hungaricum]
MDLIYSRIFKIFFLVFFLSSCSSDLDFDQTKNLKLEPAFVANLAYFDVKANDLIVDDEIQVLAGVGGFDVFKDKFFNDHLRKAELDFEIENTIARAFAVRFLLLNANDEVLQTISFAVPAYNGTSNIIKYPTEVFENQRLELLKQTVKIGTVVVMGSGQPLDQNSSGSLKLRSGATAYIVIE